MLSPVGSNASFTACATLRTKRASASASSSLRSSIVGAWRVGTTRTAPCRAGKGFTKAAARSCRSINAPFFIVSASAPTLPSKFSQNGHGSLSGSSNGMGLALLVDLGSTATRRLRASPAARARALCRAGPNTLTPSAGRWVCPRLCGRRESDRRTRPVSVSARLWRR